MSNDYDVIIIGSGAGGGTLARVLAPTGKRILILERGGRLPREKDNWDPKRVFVDLKYQTAETWLDRDDKPLRPGNHYNVGGNTKVYGAALFRLRDRDFEQVRHDGGLSPEWPVKYAEFASFYRRAEAMYEVHGRRGEDSSEPPESEPYPHPPVAHEPRIERLRDDLLQAGLHPFSLPLGLRLNEQDRAKSPCIKCATCDGFPCLLHAKADAEIVGVDPALESPNVTLITDALVERLLVTPSGREVSSVVARRAGVEEIYRGALVVVSCGAINSAALLLRSACDAHPQGLANGSGLLGRNYMCHNNSAMLAVSIEPNPTIFQKTLGLNDFYFESPASEFPMGHIQLLGKSDGDILKEHAPAFAPGFALDLLAKHAIDFWLTSEDLPDPNNRVELGTDGKIKLIYTENNLHAHERLVATLKGLLGRLGCHDSLLPHSLQVTTKLPLAAVGHQVGTMKFGADARESVLNLDCRSHEIDNLYVVDGSFFPSVSAVNPSLTIMANALRVGDHLKERLS